MAQTSPSTALVFTPADDRQVADILDCLADPDMTLAGVAERHNTTFQALALWLTRPDVAPKIRAIEGAFATITRLRVADALPAVAQTLVEVVRDAQGELDHVPLNPRSLRHLEQRTRARETARKACALLVRLARFTGGPTPERRPRPSSQAGDETPSPSSSSSSTSTPEGRCEAHGRVSSWQPPRHASEQDEPDLDEVIAELRSMGFTIEHPRYRPGEGRRHAGDEPSSHLPSSPPSTATPEGPCEAHPRVSPSPDSPPFTDSPHAQTPAHQSHSSHQSHQSHSSAPNPTPGRESTVREVVLTIDAKSRPADADTTSKRNRRTHDPQPRRPTDHPRAPT